MRVDTALFDSQVEDHVRRQLPFAASVALNKTANVAKQALVAEMRDVFDRPTPYTLGSLRVMRATKQQAVATLGFIDESFKGIPATEYLLPQVQGGSRSVKRLELLLRRRGLLPADMYVVPGTGAKLDRYGNLSRGQYSQILAQLQASRDPLQNETARSRKRKRDKVSLPARYFVGQPGGGKLPLGVWARHTFMRGSAVRPVLMFVRAPKYTARFRFDQVVEAVVARTLPVELKSAMAMALATRKR